MDIRSNIFVLIFFSVLKKNIFLFQNSYIIHCIFYETYIHIICSFFTFHFQILNFALKQEVSFHLFKQVCTNFQNNGNFVPWTSDLTWRFTLTTPFKDVPYLHPWKLKIHPSFYSILEYFMRSVNTVESGY